MRKVISRQEAAALVQDGMTLGMLGFVTLSVPEELLVSLEERFLAEGHPRDLNVFYTSAIGDRKSTRLNSSHIQKSRMPSSA